MLSYANQLAEIKIICKCFDNIRIRFSEKDFEEILKVVASRQNSIKLNINIKNFCEFKEYRKKVDKREIYHL